MNPGVMKAKAMSIWGQCYLSDFFDLNGIHVWIASQDMLSFWKKETDFSFDGWFLRLALRALLLIILATAKGALVSLEQPGSSRMKYLPEFIRTGKLINQYLGDKFWKEQFLSETQLKMVL